MLLYMDRVTVRYWSAPKRDEAVSRVSLSMKEGEVLSLVGGSGSGKTTLALAVARLTDLLPCSVEGSIVYKGQNVLEMDEAEILKLRRASVSYVFQDPASALNPVLTIGAQVREALHGVSKSLEKMEEALRTVGFADPVRIGRAYPHELSGGMKQRAVIAMALAKEPELLVADEPTTALDAASQKDILRLIAGQKRRGIGVLLITHDLNVARSLSDRILVMQAGKIVDEILSPRNSVGAHPYTRKLWNCAMAGAHPKTFFEVG